MQNGTPIDEALLHRHADGDLSPAETAELDAQLADSPTARAQYDGILRLRRLMEASGAHMAAQVDSDRLFAAIEAGIEAEAAEAKAAAPAAQEAAHGGLRGLWESFVGGHAWMPAAGMLAAIGAALLTIYSPVDHTQLPSGGVEPPGDEAAALSADAPEAPAADTETGTETGATAQPPEPSAGSEVVQVDFGQSAGTVFEIALDDGSSTPVIWINDDE